MAGPEPVSCAIVPPVPVPYREPLFARLARSERVRPTVVYQAAAQPGWDQRSDWFPQGHPYPARALRSLQRARPGRSPVSFPVGLGHALRALDPAVVVSWEFGPATLATLAWCRLRRRALVVFSEVTADGERALAPLQRRLHRALAPRVDGFVAASGAARRRLLALGVEPERVEVSLQSADLDAVAAAGARRAGDSLVRVLSVGRLVPDKNHAALIAAFGALEPGEAQLELCGTGPLERQLREQAQRLAGAVRFAGYVPPDELPRRYAASDVLALVSTFEPFGAALREGAAAGLALVCTRSAGAVGDVAVEGENALIVDPHSEASIATALRRVVRDPVLRARLQAGSRAVSARTPLERDVAAFERAVLRAAGRE